MKGTLIVLLDLRLAPFNLSFDLELIFGPMLDLTQTLTNCHFGSRVHLAYLFPDFRSLERLPLPLPAPAFQFRPMQPVEMMQSYERQASSSCLLLFQRV